MDKLQEPNDGNSRGSTQLVVRRALDDTIISLGGPIYKTITWHMNNRGVLSDPKSIDLSAFYSNLKELIGPGADMIIEETWQKVKKEYKGNLELGSGTTLEKLIRMVKNRGEANGETVC
jgi:hypothetical protein